MQPADISALTTAYEPTQLLSTFEGFAPYIVVVIGVIIGVSLVRWAYRKIRGLLSHGV